MRGDLTSLIIAYRRPGPVPMGRIPPVLLGKGPQARVGVVNELREGGIASGAGGIRESLNKRRHGHEKPGLKSLGHAFMGSPDGSHREEPARGSHVGTNGFRKVKTGRQFWHREEKKKRNYK